MNSPAKTATPAVASYGCHYGLVAAIVLLLADTAHGATVSFNPSNAPPVSPVGSVSISNLFNAYYSPAHGSDFGAGANVGSGGSGGGSDGTYTYIADDKAVAGQTFTTGTNPAGYKVLAVTLRAVAYSSTFSWVPSTEYAIRITQPGTNGNNTLNGTNTLTVLAKETAEVGVDWGNCDTCNVPSIGSGASKGPGCGRYITFTLDTPVALLPNTIYGFDVGLNTDTNVSQTFYWETDGRAYVPQTGYPSVDLYTNGNAYGSGAWTSSSVRMGGHGDNTMTNLPGDRCFIVVLTPGNIVNPPRFTTQITSGGGSTANQPQSGKFYVGAAGRFRARAAGDTNLVYQWRMDGTNINDNTKFSGTSTDSLTVNNVSAADSGSYTLVVTNLAGAVTSAPPATLTVVPGPVPGTYAYAVFTNRPIAHWRLNEAVNPATNPPTFDNVGGGVGGWETNVLQASGPRPPVFPGFESSNLGSQSRVTNYPGPTQMDRCWTTLSPLYLYTNTVTLTAWIFPNGAQAQFAGLFHTDANSTRAGMQFGDSTAPSSPGTLCYTWNNGAIRAWTSGFTIPANQWTFIGLVITPTNGTVYFGANGGPLQFAVNTATHVVENWSGKWTAGYDPKWAGTPQYVFNGVVDEAAAWNRALSFNEMTNLYAAAFTSAASGSTATAVVSGSATICNGSSNTISAALTGTSPWNVTWSDSVTQNGVTTSPATRSVSPSTTTTYTVTALSDANGAAPPGNLTGSAVVTVNARPTSAVSGSATICNGSSNTISAALTGTGPWNLTWSDSVTQNGVATSPATRSVAPSTTTTYTVTALSDANCTAQPGDRTGSAVVTVNARPTSAVSGSATICNGSSNTISAALTGTGPWNVTWSDSVTQNGVATSPATRSVSPSTTTTYTVTALSDANCTAQSGDRTGSAVVTVNSCPAPVTITSISGITLAYTGGAGSKFVLLKSATVSVALSSWSRVATNTVTPGSFTIPAVGTGGASVFYAVKSE